MNGLDELLERAFEAARDAGRTSIDPPSRRTFEAVQGAILQAQDSLRDGRRGDLAADVELAVDRAREAVATVSARDRAAAELVRTRVGVVAAALAPSE